MGGDEVTRFWEKVAVTDDVDACWLWQATKNQDGYGRFRVNGKLVQAHRYSYELHGGLIPDGLHVLHTCDRPNCVNPTHLFAGTHADNMQDMYRKQRKVHGRPPTCHPDRKLHAKGLCRACYLKQWASAHPEKSREYYDTFWRKRRANQSTN